MNPSLLALSYFFHLVATVVWLGGMALLLLILYPLAKRNIEWQPLVSSIEKRFRPFANFSLLVLLVTGVIQTNVDDNYSGLLDFSTAWSQAILAKHVVFLPMVGIIVFLQFGLAPALERLQLLATKTDVQDDLQKLRQREMRLQQANMLFGTLVLVFTAIATAL